VSAGTTAGADPAGPGDPGPGSRPTQGDALATHLVGSSVMAERTVALVNDRLEAGVAPSDIAVLARVNSALLPVQVALTEAGVPSGAPLDATVLGRTGIRTALAYLRLGLDPERIAREDVLDTLNRPARKVKSAVEPLLRRDRRWSMARLEQLRDALTGAHHDRFGDYLADLHRLSAAITDGADTARCLWIIRNRIGLGEAMDALDASRTRPEGSSHGDDLDALEQLAALQPDPAAFRGWLADRLRVPGDATGVTLSTVHRVKGMEWDHVVVFAANAGLFPHRLAEEVEEERRVFHVAITRCRERVDVVGDRDRPSPFVADLRRPAERRPPEAGAAPTTAEPTSPTRRPDGAVVAEPGVEVTLPGGLAGRVVEVGAGLARVRLSSGIEVEVGFGDPLDVEGERTSLDAPPRAGRAATAGDLAASEADASLVEALKAWRSRTAVEAGVPAYLVFHDRHLEAIAGRKPRTVRELADCPGVGPAKLDRYADDVLTIVEDAHPG
jgi:hypothetical protein